MHASHRSARLAPKKANLMAKIVRGLTVPDAVEMLRRTSKKSARLFEVVLHSAMANAQHNFKQDPQMLVIKEVVVNQGTHMRRGVPMARGRVRPIKKFMCHIDITLGFPEDLEVKKNNAQKKKDKKNGVKKPVAAAAAKPKAAKTPATKKPDSSASSK